MELERLQDKLNHNKKGRYFTITYVKVYGDFTKTVTVTLRIAKYSSVAKKDPETIKKNPNDIYLGNNIIRNVHTGKTRLQVFLTKSKTHKPVVHYHYLDQEISKEDFYQGSGQKPSKAPDTMYNIFIETIVAINGKA